MFKFGSSLIGLFIIFVWLVGVVFATGFWSTTFSILLPPYAWYLVVEYFMILYGIV